MSENILQKMADVDSSVSQIKQWKIDYTKDVAEIRCEIDSQESHEKLARTLKFLNQLGDMELELETKRDALVSALNAAYKKFPVETSKGIL